MSSGSNNSKDTPKKTAIRDVKGLLSLQEDSPSQPDIYWSDSPVKQHNRSVGGGRSKTLKSSNQLTPRNHIIRKKYYSSPILVAKCENGTDQTTSNQAENLRILEEFQRQLNNDNYVPRNLLENLTESLEDSIILQDTKEEETKECDLSEHLDLDLLAEIEEQAQRSLDEKSKSATKEIVKPIEVKKTSQVPDNFFDSDDDDLILSIPIEKLIEESSSSTATNSNTKQANQPINGMKNSNTARNSVIPTKKVAGSSSEKVQNNPPVTRSNLEPTTSTTQEPQAKRRCTSEEIAEKRRQAMLRREAYLRSLKETQQSKKT